MLKYDERDRQTQGQTDGQKHTEEQIQQDTKEIKDKTIHYDFVLDKTVINQLIKEGAGKN